MCDGLIKGGGEGGERERGPIEKVVRKGEKVVKMGFYRFFDFLE